eukprot:403370312
MYKLIALTVLATVTTSAFSEHVHSPSRSQKSYQNSFLSLITDDNTKSQDSPGNVENIPLIEKGQKWPDVLNMPFQFEATYMKYHYDNKNPSKIVPYEGRKSHKTRLIDSENNRYASDSYDGDSFYQKVVDYKNKLVMTKLGDDVCQNFTLDYNYNLKQHFEDLYNYESGMLKYTGLIDAPWDHSQKFHGFEQTLEKGKTDVYYYSEITGNLLWVKKDYGKFPKVYEYRQGLEKASFTDSEFQIQC